MCACWCSKLTWHMFLFLSYFGTYVVHVCVWVWVYVSGRTCRVCMCACVRISANIYACAVIQVEKIVTFISWRLFTPSNSYQLIHRKARGFQTIFHVRIMTQFAKEFHKSVSLTGWQSAVVMRCSLIINLWRCLPRWRRYSCAGTGSQLVAVTSTSTV